MLTSHRLVTSLLALVVLVGCGQNSPSASKTPRRTAPTASRVGVPAAALGQASVPTAAPGGDKVQGAQLLERMRRVLGETHGFEAEILAKTQGYWKQGEKGTELRKVSIGYKVVWAKPTKFRAEVFNAPTPLMEGAGLVTHDGRNITARSKGILGLIPIKLAANDPKLGNARNHTFDKYGPNNQIQRLTGPTAVWTVIGENQAANGTVIKVVAIDNVPRLDPGIDRETLSLDPQSALMKSMTGWEKGTKVVDYTFTKFGWNPKVTEDTFKL